MCILGFPGSDRAAGSGSAGQARREASVKRTVKTARSRAIMREFSRIPAAGGWPAAPHSDFAGLVTAVTDFL
jgi:hypothetical protein